MIAWIDALSLMLCTGLVGFIYGRHYEWKKSFQKRVEVVIEDRKDKARGAHQRATTENNIARRISNALGGSGRYTAVEYRVVNGLESSHKVRVFRSVEGGAKDLAFIWVDLSSDDRKGDIKVVLGEEEPIYYTSTDSSVEFAIRQVREFLKEA